MPVLDGGIDELFGTELESVGLLVGRMRDGIGFSAEGGRPEESEVAKTAAERISVSNSYVRRIEATYIPRMAIFFPGPALARTKGDQVVSPAHIMGAASSLVMFEGIGKVKYS